MRFALKRLVERATGNHIAPHRTFGKLYDALGDYLTDEAFTPFRNILRDCILETWPIATGELVLGEALRDRMLHTPTTAAQEAGLSVGLVEQFLIDAGAVPENDDRPPALRTFDAARYADLLAEIPILVGPLEMQAAIGATKAQLRSLRDDGILLPRIARRKINSPWRIADGLALIGELEALAIGIQPGDSDWEDIQSASKRKRLRVGNIIAAVRGGELRLGRQHGMSGYRFFMVMKSEVDKMASRHPHTRFHNGSGPVGRPASGFARDLGMRAKGWFQSLFDEGHVSARWVRHPITNTRILYVSDEDIEAFNRRFVTLPRMQEEFGIHRQTCAARLRAAGVRPFSPQGRDFGPLYERKQVDPVLCAGRS